jgi:hypothetical protein
MEKQLARLAIVQVGLVVYAVFVAAAFMKIASVYPTASQTGAAQFTQGVRDFGVWMLLVPAVWSAISFWLQRRPEGDASTFTGLYISGIVVVVFLLCYALRASAAFLVLFS